MPPAPVGLAHAQLDLLVEHGQQGHRVRHPAVHADHGDGAAPPHEVDGEVESREPVHAEAPHHPRGQRVRQQGGQALGALRQGRSVGFHADGVDHGIGAAAVRQLAHRVGEARSLSGEVEGVAAVCGGAPEAFGYEVDADDPARAPVGGDTGGHVADGTEPEDGHGGAGRNRGVLDGLPGGGQDVGEVHEAVVGSVGRDGDGKRVAEGHAEVLGLPARHLPVQLRVAEESRAAAVLVHLGGLALRVQPLAARVAAAAGNIERHHDPVAGSYARDVGAGLHHDAHRLVAGGYPESARCRCRYRSGEP